MVDDEGNIKAATSPVWRQRIRWQRLKAGNKNRDDEDSGERREGDGEKELKETVYGTPVKLLDDLKTWWQ